MTNRLADEPPVGSEITVQAVAPAFADIFAEKAAKLTCKVGNLPGAEGLVISWWKEATGEALETKTSPRVLQPNGLFSAEGVASVCAEDWEKGEVYTCKVAHPDLLFPAEVKLQKSSGEWGEGEERGGWGVGGGGGGGGDGVGFRANLGKIGAIASNFARIWGKFG